LISIDSSSSFIFSNSSSLFFVAMVISFLLNISLISWNSFFDFPKISWESLKVWIFVWNCLILSWSSFISFDVLSRTNASLLIFISIVFWCSAFILFCWKLFLSVSYSLVNSFSVSMSLISDCFC